MRSLPLTLLLGPNERRCITREALGFYRALLVGGIYQFSEPVEVTSIYTYAHALRQCVGRHPLLSVTVAEGETNSPHYAFCPHLDLNQHVQFLEPDGEGEGEIETIERVLPSLLDAPWPTSIPAWKIIVLPFSQTRCFIGLSFSHALGDGVSGLAFHGTFLEALQAQRLEKDLTCTPMLKPLNPPFDTAKNIPISWSFLLSPLLGAFLPTWVASLFGFRAAAGSITPGTWTASPFFYTPEGYRTGVQMFTVDARTVNATLGACRMNGAKLTGLMHQLIITALSESLPQPNDVNRFAAATALNMRGPVGVSNDVMGLYSSGDFQSHPLQKSHTGADGEFSWALAKSITDKLAASATELHDQPVGLLRYLSDMRSWFLSKIGQRRDCSYEVSNLLTFKPSSPTEQCSVTEMVFCQPADVTGAVLTFNIVSAANGPMTVAVNWQIGALDLGSHNEEVRFVRTVCQKIEGSLTRVSTSCQS